MLRATVAVLILIDYMLASFSPTNLSRRARGFSERMKSKHMGVFSGRRLIGGSAILLFIFAAGLARQVFPFPDLRPEEQLSVAQPLLVRWEYETDRTVNLTPATSDEHVYLPLTAGALLSLRLKDGGINWREEAGGEFSAAPLADERGVYIATEIIAPSTGNFIRATGTLRALGRNSGVTLWMRTLQSPLRGGLVADGGMLFGGATDGRVYAFRRETGEITWMKQFNTSFASQPVISQGRIYIGGEDGTLFVLDERTGESLWRYRTRGAVRGPVAVSDQMVFFGSADSYVYALTQREGRLLWRTRTGAEVQAVGLTPRGLVAASFDNFVYFLSTRRGDRLWKRQLAGRLPSQPLIFPEAALFAPLAGEACIVLDLKDGKQLNNLSVGEGNNMAASPVLGGQLLLVTTRKGLVAFGQTGNRPAK